jgi:hypothetical protein
MLLFASVGLALAQFVSSHVSSHAPSTLPEGPAPSACGITWKVPKGWTTLPNVSSMRIATYRTASAPGDPEGAEVAVFYFGQGQGGSVESNVSRWAAQFEPVSKPAPKKTMVGGIPVTTVTAEGTYSSGMPGGPTTPKTGWALYGAIAEGPRGAVFFKLTGPRKTVAKVSPELDELLKTLKAN